MKAVQVRLPASLDNLVVAELPEPPAPSPGQIKVRVRASSLNYHDYAVVTGVIPTVDGRVPMSDGGGEVIEVGEGVSEIVPGDAVVSTFFTTWLEGQRPRGAPATVPGDGLDGFAREFVVAPATSFTKVPQGYSHAEAANLTCAGVTAWRALVGNGALKAGETVLIQGSGGVSVFALQIAKMMGATVIATSSSDEKLERLKALGADHLINYRSEEKWGKAALKLTAGQGVDHVVEIGGAGTLEQSMIAARSGGHIAMIGVLAGYGGPVSTSQLMGKELRIIGLTVGSRRHQLDLIAAIDANGLRPVIDSHFPLEQLAEAFRHQESGRHFGKIVIDV